VRYLESTAQEADLLVVGVASDATVTHLEGEGRPILAAEHRAALVAALRCVDFVVVYPEPTAGPLAEALHPDVHRAGGPGTES
jgi:bifunctional ADP-heptose synthase (sugar kinase/adenylyltransferase)